jgi:hypothetical protein
VFTASIIREITAASTSGMSVNFYHNTQRSNQEDGYLRTVSFFSPEDTDYIDKI